MSEKMIKFDLSVMDTNTDRFKYIKPVTSLDTFQGMSKDFHEDGLFSTSIFGRVGTPDRDTRHSFIDIRINVFHPKIYALLCSTKQLYKGIMNGTAYAVWSDEEKDFVKATNLTGETGYHFFLTHWEKIVFVKNNSDQRSDAIDDILKAKKKGVALGHRIMVIPAGLRDIEMSDNEEVTKHEVNDFYVRLLSISNSLPNSGDLNTELNNKPRIALQNAWCELYEYLSTLVGRLKKSFIRRKFATRKIKYGSRDVITSNENTPRFINDPKSLKFNETAIGLYQASAVYAPVLIHALLHGYLANIVSPNPGSLKLINPKTLTREEVVVKPKVYDRWTTPTGVSKVIDSLADNHIRNRHIMINGYYLGLVYRDDKHFRLINDVNDLAIEGQSIEGRIEIDLKNVYPITYAELFYIHGYRLFPKYPATVTRYPINGYRSIYPTYPHVLTTNKDFELTWLDENFIPVKDIVAHHYPSPIDDNWFDSMAVHQSRLVGLGGDFDGDMCNFNPSFSNESIAAVDKYINSEASYVNSAGKLLNDPFSAEVLQRVLWSLSGDPT